MASLKFQARSKFKLSALGTYLPARISCNPDAVLVRPDIWRHAS